MSVMKRPPALIAVLTLAACASTPPKDHPAAAPPPPANDCHCDDDASNELHGVAFKGRIVAVQAEQGVVLVASHEIPGALPAGTHEFKAAPEALAAVQPGHDILGRIEQRNGEWWLFDVRLLVPLHAAP
jgi:Copper binding periplasmic protein CusF